MTAPSRACRVELTCDLSAPRTARHLVALLLLQWGVSDQDLLDGATVVLSELVTNVVVHCADGDPVAVQVELQEDRVRLAVEDRTPVVPVQRRPGTEDENGRGLGLVTHLAVHWEVQVLPTGKRVIVELPTPAARCA